PSLYLINSTSLAKPHALQHLQADIILYQSQIVIVTETWFKKHHSAEQFNIDGFHSYRRDRRGRKGGGVAIYITTTVKSETFHPSNDNQAFEVLWIKSLLHGYDFYIGGIYHPPSPQYKVSDLLMYLDYSINEIINSSTR